MSRGIGQVISRLLVGGAMAVMAGCGADLAGPWDYSTPPNPSCSFGIDPILTFSSYTVSPFARHYAVTGSCVMVGDAPGCGQSQASSGHFTSRTAINGANDNITMTAECTCDAGSAVCEPGSSFMSINSFPGTAVDNDNDGVADVMNGTISLSVLGQPPITGPFTFTHL